MATNSNINNTGSDILVVTPVLSLAHKRESFVRSSEAVVVQNMTIAGSDQKISFDVKAWCERSGLFQEILQGEQQVDTFEVGAPDHASLPILCSYLETGVIDGRSVTRTNWFGLVANSEAWKVPGFTDYLADALMSNFEVLTSQDAFNCDRVSFAFLRRVICASRSQRNMLALSESRKMKWLLSWARNWDFQARRGDENWDLTLLLRESVDVCQLTIEELLTGQQLNSHVFALLDASDMLTKLVPQGASKLGCVRCQQQVFDVDLKPFMCAKHTGHRSMLKKQMSCCGKPKAEACMSSPHKFCK